MDTFIFNICYDGDSTTNAIDLVNDLKDLRAQGLEVNVLDKGEPTMYDPEILEIKGEYAKVLEIMDEYGFDEDDCSAAHGAAILKNC